MSLEILTDLDLCDLTPEEQEAFLAWNDPLVKITISALSENEQWQD